MWMNIQNQTFGISSKSLLPESCTRNGLVAYFDNNWTNKSGTPQIPQLIKRHETEPQIKSLIMCCPSAYTLFRTGKQSLGF